MLRRPGVRLHRRKSKVVIGSIMRFTPLSGGGGSLPALVAGIPTAPLAHTIHSTSRAVPPAVVSVVGACSAARECGCTALSAMDAAPALAVSPRVRLQRCLWPQDRVVCHRLSVEPAQGTL